VVGRQCTNFSGGAAARPERVRWHAMPTPAGSGVRPGAKRPVRCSLGPC